MANICRSLRKKKTICSPQVTYPYRIYWCKKNGSKISHLGTFKASIADLITLLSSSVQNSEGGGDGDGGESCVDPCQEFKQGFLGVSTF